MTELDVVNKLAPLIIQHSMRLTTMWSFQIVVFVGVIGWVFSHTRELNSLWNRLLLISAVGAFGWFTWATVESITERKHAAWNALRTEIVAVQDAKEPKSSKPLECKKSGPTELGELRQYVCALQPHPLSNKGWALIGGNAILLLFIGVSPSARLRKKKPGKDAHNEAVQPTGDPASG